MRSSIRFTLIFAVMPLIWACADDADCDDGQTLEDGRCVSPTSNSTSSTSGGGEGGAPSTGGEAGAPSTRGEAGAPSTFGAPCTDDETHAECGGDATYCAVQPGQAEGYCTATGCTENPEVCPSDWGCLNLGAFDPTLPSVCTRP